MASRCCRVHRTTRRCANHDRYGIFPLLYARQRPSKGFATARDAIGIVAKVLSGVSRNSHSLVRIGIGVLLHYTP
jgi:hypothetical protein